MSLALRIPFTGGSVTLAHDALGASVNLSNFGVVAAEDDTYGQVASFDGTTHLELTASSVPSTASGGATRSVSVWVNPLSPSVCLFSMGDESAAGSLLRVSLDASMRVKVEYSGLQESISILSLALGEWSHVLLSYDGSNVQCYVNGALGADDARELSTGEAPLALGEAFGSAWAFEGRMSDFRIYDHFFPVHDVTDLHERGPNELLHVDTTVLAVFEGDGIQPDVALNDSVVAVGNVTAKSLTLVAEKTPSGETEAASFVYMHDPATSERICISENVHTVNADETQSTSILKLCGTNSVGDRVSQKCMQYSGESVDIHSVSSVGEQRTSRLDFEGLSFDSDEAAVVLGPFSEFRIKYDDVTDTLQIQRLQSGVYTTKVEYGR